MSSRADDSDADEASEHADESAVPRIARRIWGPETTDVSIGAPAAVASVQLQPRCIPFELLQEAEHADESAGPRIARRIWGPVTKDVSASIGFTAAVASVQLQPRCIPFELLQEVHALVPVEVLPTAEDTKRSLAARLAKSDYLHPVFVLNKGNGTGKCKYVQLNRTEYAQPRRVRWGSPAGHNVEQDLVRLPSYPHNYTRSPLDITCERVPEAIEKLSQLLWKESLPFLAPNSVSAPPNYWQQCIYYTAFKGEMGRHRDNYSSQDLVSYLESNDPSVLTSARFAQVPNSSVMIYTMGNAPMNLRLSYPESRSAASDRQKYVTHASLCVKLSHGTLFILAPTDDLFFCHEVAFDPSTLVEKGAAGYRIALVMRWIRDEHFMWFHLKGSLMRSLAVSPSEAEAERKGKIRRRAERMRRLKVLAFTSP